MITKDENAVIVWGKIGMKVLLEWLASKLSNNHKKSFYFSIHNGIAKVVQEQMQNIDLYESLFPKPHIFYWDMVGIKMQLVFPLKRKFRKFKFL